MGLGVVVCKGCATRVRFDQPFSPIEEKTRIAHTLERCEDIQRSRKKDK
jgi:hypothetical protein